MPNSNLIAGVTALFAIALGFYGLIAHQVFCHKVRSRGLGISLLSQGVLFYAEIKYFAAGRAFRNRRLDWVAVSIMVAIALSVSLILYGVAQGWIPG